ncbi:MAG: zinc ribbon domain-containing protein [Chloroflexi bacterium]|nr:zinc ribbon domain-containing protein [Chloroflexota bacterium]
MDCVQCGSYVDSSDNYCRDCGARLRPSTLPMVLNPRIDLTSLQPARPIMWRGAAILAGSLFLEILRRRLISTDRWIDIPLALLDRRNEKSGVPASARGKTPPKSPEVEISETILLVERKIRH